MSRLIANIDHDSGEKTYVERNKETAEVNKEQWSDNIARDPHGKKSTPEEERHCDADRRRWFDDPNSVGCCPSWDNAGRDRAAWLGLD
jgi:hypothetical protein